MSDFLICECRFSLKPFIISSYYLNNHNVSILFIKRLTAAKAVRCITSDSKSIYIFKLSKKIKLRFIRKQSKNCQICDTFQISVRIY